jgi:hypothetical protein
MCVDNFPAMASVPFPEVHQQSMAATADGGVGGSSKGGGYSSSRDPKRIYMWPREVLGEGRSTIFDI